eukprot:Skav224580  [mRNA]  locus=scaffold246:205088:206305:- [translate_table: standard]
MQPHTHAERQALEAFKSEQAALTWLAEQPDVAEALELAENGQEDEAGWKLAKAVEALVFADQDEQTEPVSKSRRIEPHPTHPGADASPSEAEPPNDAGAKAPRCICLFLSGMRGAGKTALCSVLQTVIGGEHVHVDEIIVTETQTSHKKAVQSCLKKALTKALAATKREKRGEGLSGANEQGTSGAEDPLAPKKLSDEGDKIVYVDRTHLLPTQRSDAIIVLQKVRRKHSSCRTLLLEFNHSSDAFGYGTDGQTSKTCGQHHIALCAERIEARGSAHHTFRPSAKLQGVLRKEAKIAEPPRAEELRHFDARLTLEVAESTVQQALTMVKELSRLGWLPALDSDALSLQVELAWQVYSRAQDAWRKGINAESAPDGEKRVVGAMQTSSRRESSRAGHGSKAHCLEV